MNDETIVAIFDTPAHAELAAADLREAGVPDSSISIHTGSATTGTTLATAPAPREEGFWSSLFGGAPDHDTSVYEHSVVNGSSVLSVVTPESHITRVLEIIESHHPIDIDDRASTYGLASTTTATTAKTAPVLPMTTPAPVVGVHPADGKLELSEETLSVGKRVINRGGTRIRRFVVETPVEESVRLHSESVILERNKVTDGRPAVDSFSNKTIEMLETAEEAIVSKVASVYEEVGLRKEVADRVETIHDTVRKEEVEIEKIPGAPVVSPVVPAKV